MNTKTNLVERIFFTAAEHLDAQRQIELRAHALWYAGGRRDDTALKDWFQAEREVVEQFIRTYVRRRVCGQAAMPGAVRKKAELRMAEQNEPANKHTSN